MSEQKDSVPSSPWKRPKIVSLAKTNSLKRKSELFHSASSGNSLANSSNGSGSTGLFGGDENNLIGSPKSAKSRKTVLNRFSVNSLNNSSPSFPSLTNSSGFFAPEKNDLGSFFGQNSTVKFDLGPNDDDSGSPEKPVPTNTANAAAFKDISSSMISNICFGLGNFPRASTGLEQPAAEIEVEPEKKYLFQGELIPMDWSLKTRCRFMSRKPFSCSTALKSSHEYKAVRNFCKHDYFYENLSKHQFNSSKENEDLYKTLFGESASYWMAPFLPWMNLYPRSSSTGFGNLSNMAHPLSTEIQLSIFDSWNASFKSLSYGLRNGDCPYFYFLTHSFMVLFRAENVGDIDEVHAILTPSTKGMRDSLTANHLVFTMPLMPESRRSMDAFDCNTNPPAEADNDEKSNIDSCVAAVGEESNQVTEDGAGKNEDENEDENQEEDGEEDTDEWLKQQGLNSVNLKPSVLKRNSKNAQKDSIQSLDSRPKSTLLFRGAEAIGLFNYLHNSKGCMMNSGPMAGIPPTLISPVPFMGGVVQKLRIDQNVIKTRSSVGESLTHYTLDFTGPLMPFHIHRLCSLFSRTQSGEFEMTASTLYQTEAFNCLKPDQVQPSGANLPVNAQLGQSEADSLRKLYGIYGKVESIKTIKLDDAIYSCNELTS